VPSAGLKVIVEVCWLLEERPDIESAFLASVVRFPPRSGHGSRYE
jgi:hypothetical protein